MDTPQLKGDESIRKTLTNEQTAEADFIIAKPEGCSHEYPMRINRWFEGTYEVFISWNERSDPFFIPQTDTVSTNPNDYWIGLNHSHKVAVALVTYLENIQLRHTILYNTRLTLYFAGNTTDRKGYRGPSTDYTLNSLFDLFWKNQLDSIWEQHINTKPDRQLKMDDTVVLALTFHPCRRSLLNGFKTAALYHTAVHDYSDI